MNKVKVFFTVNYFLIFIGCFSQINIKNESVRKEDFKKLQIDFKQNLKTQLNRIYFPIKNELIDSDGLIENTTLIIKKDWLFINFSKKSYIQKWIYNLNECKLIVEIIDTGIHVEYIFKFTNKNWLLFKIVDQSS